MMLGTLTVLTMIICLTAWARIFRHHVLVAMQGGVLIADEDQHGAPAMYGFDQLTEAEVNYMFPQFQYAKKHSSALSAAGDLSCSICLGSYEETDTLRRLGCGHSYHAPCLDPWLRTNATCPRCRKRARIANVPPSRLSLLRHWLRGLVSRAGRSRMEWLRRWPRDSDSLSRGWDFYHALLAGEGAMHREVAA
jgi:hypothetical protein